MCVKIRDAYSASTSTFFSVYVRPHDDSFATALEDITSVEGALAEAVALGNFQEVFQMSLSALSVVGISEVTIGDQMVETF